ncbi:MAG: hypothetical protein AB7P76_03355 [Candidatus Melainabacteria bacterium]
MKTDSQIVEDQERFAKALIEFTDKIENLEKFDKIGPVWDDQPQDYYFGLVTRANVTAILVRFLKGELTSKDVYHWAEAIDCRETINGEPEYRELINGILSAITIDYDAGSLITKETAYEFIKSLESAKPEHV